MTMIRRCCAVVLAAVLGCHHAAVKENGAGDRHLPASSVGLTPILEVYRGAPGLWIQVVCDACEPQWLLQFSPAPQFTPGVAAGDTIGRLTAVIDVWHRSAADSLLVGAAWPAALETWMAGFGVRLGCSWWRPGSGTAVWCRAPSQPTAPWADWARRVDRALAGVSAEEAATEADRRRAAGACHDARTVRLVVDRRTAEGGRRVYFECIDPTMRTELGAGSAVYRVIDEVIAWHLQTAQGGATDGASWPRVVRP